MPTSDTSTRSSSLEAATDFTLSEQQIHFFEVFGFLRLPGLFADQVDEISEAFETVFARIPASDADVDLNHSGFQKAFADRERIDSYHHLNFGKHRAIVPGFLEKHPTLEGLLTDPRIVGTVTGLLGHDYQYRGSDGNLFWCDTAWHCDVYDAPLETYNIKLLFYLDELDESSGALRVIPGSNHFDESYAMALRKDLNDWERIEANLGVDVESVPSYVVPSEPGDLIVGSFRTMHATLNGHDRRRLFTLNYRRTD